MLQFSDIIGQDAAIDRLQRAMASDRMPHAFLFAGPAGVGRRTTAMALAATLLCSKPVMHGASPLAPAATPATASPLRQACGQCPDCRLMEAGSHPDFHLIYKELARFHDDASVRDRVMQDLGIDVVRDFLIAVANRASSCGRGKVFVVREAELISLAAQNSLLKTLEEPPRGVTLILLCQRSEQLLPTTLSRCSLIRFGPLPSEFVASRLAAEGMALPEAQFWAAFTDGSVGQALRLGKQGMYAVKRDMIDHLVAAACGANDALGEQLAKTAETLAADAVKEAKAQDGADLSAKLAGRRATGVMIQLIASAFQDAMRLNSHTEATPLPLVHEDQRPQIIHLAERFDTCTLAEIIDQLSEFERLLWRNVSPKIVWDNLAITCSTGIVTPL